MRFAYRVAGMTRNGEASLVRKSAGDQMNSRARENLRKKVFGRLPHPERTMRLEYL